MICSDVCCGDGSSEQAVISRSEDRRAEYCVLFFISASFGTNQERGLPYPEALHGQILWDYVSTMEPNRDPSTA